MIHWPCGRFSPTRLLFGIVLLSALYFLLCRILPALHYRAFQLYAWTPLGSVAYTNSYSSKIQVNLVVATTARDDISWTSRIQEIVPNLQVLRYVSDSSTAQYRPAVPNKGREALIYFTYIHDFYDRLPDVSIFVHAHENPWHVDSALRQSLPFALSQLDLEQVVKRGYFNLRASWQDACPAWINTTKSIEDGHVKEEGYMAAAFRDNFGDDIEVPDIMAGPCCSQFAVSKDTIESVPKGQYKHHIDWLVQMSDVWGDQLTGRTWEHMWPYLFLKTAKDCPVERDSFCRMYHICFPDHLALLNYQNLWAERETIKEVLATPSAFVKGLVGSEKMIEAKGRIMDIQVELNERLKDALERGHDAHIREATTLNLDW